MRIDDAEGRDFVLLARGRTRMWIRRGYRGFAARLGLAGPPEADGGWATGRTAHPVVLLARGERAVVRALRRGGALRHLNPDRYLWGRRPWEELRASEQARAAGVRTPPVLAATVHLGFGYTGSIATLRVEGAHDATAWLAGRPAEARAAMWREAGRQIAGMHGGGVAHPDLNLRNLLVAGGGGLAGRDDVEVYLLDFDRARIFPSAVAERRRARDLRRLLRSARKLGVLVDATALREGYGSGWPRAADLG
jgi:3-deoxy-D-manno-octulosonic acid kinase